MKPNRAARRKAGSTPSPEANKPAAAAPEAGAAEGGASAPEGQQPAAPQSPEVAGADGGTNTPGEEQPTTSEDQDNAAEKGAEADAQGKAVTKTDPANKTAPVAPAAAPKVRASSPAPSALDEIIRRHRLTPADILAFNPDSAVAVTRDGRKVS